VVILLVFFLVQTVVFSFLWTRQLQLASHSSTLAYAENAPPDSPHSFSHYLNDESNVRIPSNADGTPMSLEERLRYLELKVNAQSNFGVTDPFFGTKRNKHLCRNSSDLEEFGCRPGFEGYDDDETCTGSFDHAVCLDHLPKPRPDPFEPVTGEPKCLVYDMGIRANPEFGAVMARVFGCEVHAFDPSPVSKEWWKSSKADELRKLGNYHFHPYGAGGMDGELRLNGYNWGQVSILKYPSTLLDCRSKNKPDKDHCRMVDVPQQAFHVPVKTLPTIRRELGHENRTLDILKVDVEGSEYAFLEQLLDSSGGCPSYVQQIALEWHHMPWDPRYGEGSSPSINALTTILHACGLKMFWHWRAWPSKDAIYVKMGMNNMMYSLSSYVRVSNSGEKIESNRVASMVRRHT